MVIECTFVVVHVIGVRFIRIIWILGVLIKHFSQPEHIVSITGFRSLHIIEHGCEVICRVEMLAYTVSSDTYGTVIDNRIPEKAGGVIPFGCMIPIFIIL